jgi:hypothetical protein
MQQVLKTPLCDVPWDDLKVGDRVLSRKGISGQIIELNVDVRRMDNDDQKNKIVMRFGNAPSLSDQPHAWLDEVMYLGQANA